MRCVEPQEIADVWPRVERWIGQAVEVNQGDENTLDVLLAIARGAYQLWVGEGWAVVAQVTRWPRQVVGTILYAGGDLAQLQNAFPQAKSYARSHGIQVLRIWGRPGWERALGLKRVGVISQVQL